jgi:hypothetical protein
MLGRRMENGVRFTKFIVVIAIVPGVLCGRSGSAVADYTDLCKATLTRPGSLFGMFRVDYNFQSKGEAYQVGRPSETTGYYAQYEINIPSDNFILTCYADLNYKLKYAKVAGGKQRLSVCYYPDAPLTGPESSGKAC